MRLILPSRLEEIAKRLIGLDSFIDVGTDHGKLPVFCLVNGTVRYAIASDISPMSLSKAEKLAKDFSVELDTRVGDGLSVLTEDNVEGVVIAGMGGLEIIKILENTNRIFKKYILSPHTKAPELRCYLQENNFAVIEDRIVEENGKFYPIITCEKAKEKKDFRIYIGKDNYDNIAFSHYFEKRISLLSDLIEKKVPNSERYIQEKKELEEVYASCGY